MTEEDGVIPQFLIPNIEEENNESEGKKKKKVKVQDQDESFSGLVITAPREFTHHIHVDYDPERGFIGLPESWKEILNKGIDKGDITLDEVMNNKEDAVRIAGVST